MRNPDGRSQPQRVFWDSITGCFPNLPLFSCPPSPHFPKPHSHRAAMPRENRKRGKKHKRPTKHEPEPKPDPEVHQEDADYEVEQQTGDFEGGDRPSWIVQDKKPQVNPEAPFGYVDADVKAYFRTVELQIRDWQENPARGIAGHSGGDENEQDPNEGNLIPIPFHRC